MPDVHLADAKASHLLSTLDQTHPLPLCNNQGIAPVPLTSSSAETLPDAVGIPMATLNSQGKRPSPDDEGSEMSDISEGNSASGRERRTVKRQRTSSSQSAVEDQPAQFVPGLWSIVASVKNLFGLGSSAEQQIETDPTPGPALETLDRFAPDLPPLPAFHPDGRMLQGPTMPAIEATKHRMNRAFEAHNGETDGEMEKQNQEHSVIDLTGVSDGSPSPDKPKSGASPSYNAKFNQLKVRPPTPPRPSSKKNFAPSGLRVHHAFDNGLRHSVGHRGKPRLTAKMIRTTVKNSLSTANPKPKFDLAKSQYQDMISDAGPSTPSPPAQGSTHRIDDPFASTPTTKRLPFNGLPPDMGRSRMPPLRKKVKGAEGRQPNTANELIKRFAAVGVTVAESSGSPPSINGARKSGMKKDVQVDDQQNARRELAALLSRVKAPPKREPFNLKALEASLEQEREAEAKIQENLRRVALPKVAAVPTISDEMRETIKAAIKNPRFISKCLREQVEFKDLRLLNPGQWLNDEVINFYMALLQERADNDLIEVDGQKKKRRDIHCFNSHFYPKLEFDYAKSKVGRWTKKIDIFSKDIIVFPINKNNVHWLCGAINFKDKRLECYDSMNPNGHAQVYERLRRYLQAEHLDKKKTPIDLSDWVDYYDTESPQQDNGYDCGIFSCQTLEHRARGLGDGDDASAGAAWEFKQDDMLEIRQLMIYEIGQAKLVPRGNK